MSNIIKLKKLAKERLEQLNELEASQVEDLNLYHRAQYNCFTTICQLENEYVIEYIKLMKEGLHRDQKKIGAATFIGYKNAVSQCEEIIGKVETESIDEAEADTDFNSISKWIKMLLGALIIFGIIMMCTGCDSKDPIAKYERFMTLNGRKMELVDKGWDVYEGKYDSFPISYSFYSNTHIYYTIEYQDTVIDGLVIVPTTRPLYGTYYSDRRDTFFFNNYNW